MYHPSAMRCAKVLVLLLAFAPACAKNASPPLPPEPPAAPAVDAAAPNAPADVAVAATDVDAGAGTATPAPSATASAAPEPAIDECAPVAASFEQSLRPKLKKCWLDAANKKPNERIIGTIKFIVEIDGLGKIASAHQVDKSELPAPVVQCMNKAFKAEKIDTGKCTFKTLSVFEKFPR
jgi:hypothetical protein